MKQVFPSSFSFFMRVTEYFAHADGRFLATRGFLKQRIGQIRGALTQQQNNGRAPVEKHSLLGTAMNPRFCIVVQNFADQQGTDLNLCHGTERRRVHDGILAAVPDKDRDAGERDGADGVQLTGQEFPLYGGILFR